MNNLIILENNLGRRRRIYKFLIKKSQLLETRITSFFFFLEAEAIKKSMINDVESIVHFLAFCVIEEKKMKISRDFSTCRHL